MILYSLGNFATAMLFATTQIGILQEMTLVREVASGTVDWFAPKSELIANLLTTDDAGKKEVLLARDYFEACHKAGNCAGDLERRYPFFKRHVSAPDVQREELITPFPGY